MNNKNKGIHMNEGWNDVTNEGDGIAIEGIGLGIEADGYAVDLNSISI